MRHFIIIQLIAIWITSCSDPGIITLENEIDAIENGLTPKIKVNGVLENYNVYDRMNFFHIPGISIAVIHDGKLRWAKGYGLANINDSTEVTNSTMFQAGSISKPLAALAALKLMEDGMVDLDTDVNTYLKEWKVEENIHTQTEKVTLRRLLNHTAGTTVHGFPGYHQNDTFPSINQVLNGEGNTPKIYVDTIPGSIWRYSGGGYTIMEKVVEDISGLPLEKYMEENILKPLGMLNSTYEQPLPKSYYNRVSAAYDHGGNLIDGLWHNYPEQAAAGLWTTPSDLAKYCIAIQQVLNGQGNSILSKSTVKNMLTKYKNNWGMGLSLRKDGDSLMFQHGGKNAGFTNEMMAFAHKGEGLIIMTSADNGGQLMAEIKRSVSEYYQWGISTQREVEAIDLPIDSLMLYTGKYQLENRNVILDVVLEDKKLIVVPPFGRLKIIPMTPIKFIAENGGMELEFQMDDGRLSLLINGKDRFNRVEDSLQ